MDKGDFNRFLSMYKVDNNTFLTDWKNNGKKVIGYYCSYLPEEIIHAAGMLPYRIKGVENVDFIKSDAILSRFNCTYVRSTLNLILNQKYEFLDGLLIANTCDHVRRIYDVLNYQKDFKTPLFFISLPHLFSNEGWNWVKDEIYLFRESLMKSYNLKISDDDTKNAVILYNENRKLMNEIGSLRANRRPPLTGTEFSKICLVNSSIRKDYANKELKKVLSYLKSRKELKDNEYRARLMVIGSSIDNPAFISILEHANSIVIADAICSQSRSFLEKMVWKPEGYEKSSDPIKELVGATYGRVLCPRMMNFHKERLKQIEELVRKHKVDGVVLQRIEFCDLHGIENSFLQHELKEQLDVPVLNIDREYFLGDIGRLRTRVEAFIEKIERRK
ncbi:MAG: hypothetical protein GF364_00180 [Candidatus Lokiarchaeota archaeon]|nr:hypothetical protein [Candidatus Lokiarchaeota archaeon]